MLIFKTIILNLSKYTCVKLQATDQDLDINSDIRYAIVGDPVEKRYFNVDEHTGLIRTVGGFNQILNNTVFGFDIRATDKAGAPNGRSAITNVFVSFTFLENYRL